MLDPEFEINIVDLGLIYELEFQQEVKQIYIEYTLTSAGCPFAEILEELVKSELAGLAENGLNLNLTLTPPWAPARTTDEGRQQWLALGGVLPNY